MKKIIFYTIALCLVLSALSLTAQRKQIKWETSVKDGTPNMVAGWNGDGEAAEIDVSGLGGGVTNGAAADEYMLSDGTDAVASGLFSGVLGDIGKPLSTFSIFGTNHTLQLDDGAGVSEGFLRYDLIGSAATLENSGNNFTLKTSDDSFTTNNILITTGTGSADNAGSGNIHINTGASNGSGLEGNIGLFSTAGAFGDGEKVLFVGNATTAPTTNPTAGYILYANASDGSHPYVRTPAGTVHKLAHSMMNVTIATATTALSTHPNSEQQLQNANSSRTNVESTFFNQVRLVGRVSVGSASANDPRLYIQYTTDLTGAAGWTTIGDGTTASGEALDITSIGNAITDWIDIPSGAKADVLYRIAQNGGDGSATPSLVNLHIQFR
jgi:hypothetical protein